MRKQTMGMGWRVALMRELPAAAQVKVHGKALIFRQYDLDELAEQLGLTRLTDFVSVDPSAVGEFLRQQGIDPEEHPIPDEEWFTPADALPTVRGLLAHLRANPDVVLDSHRIVRDLTGIEQILVLADREAIPFHLGSEMPTDMPSEPSE
jgi:hypothetical protein